MRYHSAGPDGGRPVVTADNVLRLIGSMHCLTSVAVDIEADELARRTRRVSDRLRLRGRFWRRRHQSRPDTTNGRQRGNGHLPKSLCRGRSSEPNASELTGPNFSEQTAMCSCSCVGAPFHQSPFISLVLFSCKRRSGPLPIPPADPDVHAFTRLQHRWRITSLRGFRRTRRPFRPPVSL